MKTAIDGALTCALIAGPVWADDGKTLGQKIQEKMTKENIGRAVGAGIGALLGSQIGDGKGRLAAVALGTLAGYWIGGNVGRRLNQSDREGIARTTQTALDTGQNQSWRNPDTGAQTSVVVHDTTVERQPLQSQGLRDKVWNVPTLEPVNEFYTAKSDSNVRGGPGTDYVIMDRLARGERVPVVGRVAGQDWYLISDGSSASGFVHSSLLQRADRQPADGNALRMAAGEASSTTIAERTCSLITQEVVLADGTRESHDFRACQRADGTWEMV